MFCIAALTKRTADQPPPHGGGFAVTGEAFDLSGDRAMSSFVRSGGLRFFPGNAASIATKPEYVAHANTHDPQEGKSAPCCDDGVVESAYADGRTRYSCSACRTELFFVDF